MNRLPILFIALLVMPSVIRGEQSPSPTERSYLARRNPRWLRDEQHVYSGNWLRDHATQQHVTERPLETGGRDARNIQRSLARAKTSTIGEARPKHPAAIEWRSSEVL